MIFILTPLLGVIMIIILTVPDPCRNDYDYRSHRALDFGTVKNCDNFRDFRPFHGSQSIVTKCDEIGAMGQAMVFRAPVRVSSFCSYGRLAMRCGERCQTTEPAQNAAQCATYGFYGKWHSMPLPW